MLGTIGVMPCCQRFSLAHVNTELASVVMPRNVCLIFLQDDVSMVV